MSTSDVVHKPAPGARVQADEGHVVLTIGVSTFEMEPEQAVELALALLRRAKVASIQAVTP